MKYALCVIAASLALAACSQGQPGSSWFGSNQQPGPAYGAPVRGVPMAGRPHSNFHAAQSLRDKVHGEVAQASESGDDVSAAKRFEERGDEALRQGQITLAAEQFGRAEEALAMSRPEGSARERTEEMTEEEETTGRHRHHRHHRQHKEEASESAGRHKEEAAESSGKHKEKEEASESSESAESKEGKEAKNGYRAFLKPCGLRRMLNGALHR